jgi:UDP-N-acetylglucosamine 2-epimerase (non-hydrolysing)
VDRLHVFIGTKAQYVKTAPLLRLMDQQGVDYRLIDSGQHAQISAGMRSELGVRPPDHVLGGASDIVSIPQALRWSAGLGARLWSGARLRAEVFGGDGGICVVHGDTPSTMLSTLMARRAGLRVAHLEAGLRSHSILHPFPEEAIRLVVMRLSHVLFAPDDAAVANLRDMKVKGRVVRVEANTSVDALRWSVADGAVAGAGPAVVTMHRVETLHHRERVAALVDAVVAAAARYKIRWVLHGPTAAVLAKTGADQRLAQAGVELGPLVPHAELMRLLAEAPFVITDGGSIQEECALLGVPTLLWRMRTERPDGLGANVVLSKYDTAVLDRFLADPEPLRRDPAPLDASPSQQILDVLLEELAPTR